ncbi:3-galactosyl-N-acetylglucosaminide 4-alpha-L-fucosyltransferase FUT3-like isoform X2 [Styela clava]
MKKHTFYKFAILCVGMFFIYRVSRKISVIQIEKNIGTNEKMEVNTIILNETTERSLDQTLHWMDIHSPQPDILVDDSQFNKTRINNDTRNMTENHRPIILLWAQPYPKIEWHLPDLPSEDGGCDITVNRSEYERSEAVLFFMKSCVSNDLPDPAKRSPNQVFVWWAHESPWTVLHYYHYKLKDFNEYFNWTMTYRRDSDVLASLAPTPSLDYFLYKFGRQNEMKDAELLRRPTMSKDRFREEIGLLMSKKTKMISWVVSDCKDIAGASKRMQLVNEMTKDGLLDVDRYGKCAKRPIANDVNVLLETIKKYKFYLSFENSFHCRDYITEKTFYNAIVGGIVPIINGPTKEDVSAILPNGSFIHMDDFENQNKLAEYLKYLDSNDTAYLEYFDWWKEPGTHVIPRYGFNFGPQHDYSNSSDWFQFWKPEDTISGGVKEFEFKRFGLYHLCRKLRNKEHITTSKVIADLNQWWYGTESEECIR